MSLRFATYFQVYSALSSSSRMHLNLQKWLIFLQDKMKTDKKLLTNNMSCTLFLKTKIIWIISTQ